MGSLNNNQIDNN